MQKGDFKMKVVKVTEHKDGTATMVLETTKEERDFLIEVGVITMLKDQLKIFEDSLIVEPKGYKAKAKKK